MVKLHPEYVVDGKDKKKAVILPVDEWEKVIDELEELEDIRLYDAAKTGNEESVPFEQAVAEIEGADPG
jgi:PHD/YefM family antitoxin component YafN of YafNO toxin-antitoxin module